MLQHPETTAFAQLQIDHGGVEGGAVERGDGRRFGIDLAAHADALAVFKQCDQMLAYQQRIFDKQHPHRWLTCCVGMSEAIPRQYRVSGGGKARSCKFRTKQLRQM
jgi:hypothetical protein